MFGKIYVVATPIGNLQDITFRGIEVLKEVDIIFAEDTRKTSVLLKAYGIEAKHLDSYHQHSLLAKREKILTLLLDGKSIALVTDAGTPGISDPGNELIDYIFSRWPKGELGKDNIEEERADLSVPGPEIIPIPGASSLTAALSVSGFNVNKFLFLGFLPKKKRTKMFEWAKEGRISIAFFDSPHRLYKTLLNISEHFGGGKRILIARELTKIHETLYRGSIEEIIRQFDKRASAKKNDHLKGEVVVIVEN